MYVRRWNIELKSRWKFGSVLATNNQPTAHFPDFQADFPWELGDGLYWKEGLDFPHKHEK